MRFYFRSLSFLCDLDFCATELIPFSPPSPPDDFLSDLLRAVPQLLPLSRGASHGGEQGELVLQALQILPRVWPSKQEHKGKGLIFAAEKETFEQEGLTHPLCSPPRSLCCSAEDAKPPTTQVAWDQHTPNP